MNEAAFSHRRASLEAVVPVGLEQHVAFHDLDFYSELGRRGYIRYRKIDNPLDVRRPSFGRYYGATAVKWQGRSEDKDFTVCEGDGLTHWPR